MVNYKLIQGKMNDNIEFNRVPGFEDLRNNKLTDIIKFTGNFESYSSLKDCLRAYYLLKNEGKITIAYAYKGIIKNISIPFKDDIKFLDYNNICVFLKNNIKNIDFLQKIYNNEKKYYDTNMNHLPYNINEFSRYMHLLNRYPDNVTLDIEEAFFDYLTRIVLCRISSKNIKTGKYDISFSKTRQYGMYLSNLAKQISNLDFSDMNYKNQIIDYIDEHKNIVLKSKTLQKTKKKNQVDGQISLFDL